MPDAAVIEAPVEQQSAPVTNTPDDVMSLMREALRETTPATTQPSAEPEPEVTAEPVAGEPVAPAEQPKAGPQPGSRRAKTVEKVKTEAEQTVADAEARAEAAEKRAREAEAKLQEQAQSQTDAAAQQRAETLAREYGEWVGTTEQYDEAQRLSRLSPDDDGWDWEKHKVAVDNLNQWDTRRKWAGNLMEAAKGAGRAEANRAIAQDFLVTLAEDLPEDRRDAYRSHKDGIPGAVRFYAETINASKIEALETQLAEKDAEIERLKAGGSGRAPLAGGPSGNSAPRFDYARQTPEEMMAEELRSQHRGHR